MVANNTSLAKASDLPPIEVESEARSSIAEVAVPSPDAYGLRDLHAQEEMAFWASLMFFAAVASVAITALGTFLLWRQIRLTRLAVEDTSKATKAVLAANTIAEDTAERQLRAYLSANGSRVKLSKAGYQDGKIALSVDMGFDVKNHGNVPASNIRVWCDIRMVPSPISEESLKSLNEQLTGNRWLPPQQVGDYSFAKMVLVDETKFNSQQRESLLVSGVIRYDDGFRKERYTSFTGEIVGVDEVLSRPPTDATFNMTFKIAEFGNEGS